MYEVNREDNDVVLSQLKYLKYNNIPCDYQTFSS